VEFNCFTDNKGKRGILSLPNLETKFVAAHALLSPSKSQKTITSHILNSYKKIEQMSDVISKVEHKYFASVYEYKAVLK
jgi:hypothetical protein